jgi:alkylhydroperoxidase family enzyme
VQLGARSRQQPADGGRGAVVAELTDAVLGPRGEAPIERRRAALELGVAAAGGGDPAAAPEELGAAAPLAEKVARHAYRVTDEDVAELKQSGHGDGDLFDLIVCTATGAGLGRRRLGLAAVDAWEQRR